MRAELFPLMSDGGRERAARELAALDGLPPLTSGWGDGSTVGRITEIRGTFALQQALYAIRDSDEEEPGDGLTGDR